MPADRSQLDAPAYEIDAKTAAQDGSADPDVGITEGRSEMFQVKKSIGKVVRHTAAALVLGGVALTSTAGATHAQTVAGDGMIRLGADCYLSTNRANVFVTVQTPWKYSSTGLVYYLRIWAKGDRMSNWVQLGSDLQTGTVNTITKINSAYSMNNPRTIATASFTGTDGNYDLYLQYWFKTPGSSTWSPMYGFSMTGDGDSQATIYSNSYGAIGSPSKICTL